MKYIVSACLAGEKCRYDGSSCLNERVAELVEKGEATPVCPEQLAGLPTPRPSAEIKDGEVILENGARVTRKYMMGAYEALNLARRVEAEEAILKSKIPSCGCGKIYDGSFSGKLKKGDGVFTIVLKQSNIKVYTEEDLDSIPR